MKTHSKIFSLFLFLFLFSAVDNNVSAQAEKENQIRFDGLYRTDQMSDPKDADYKYFSYFRFCENGTVTGMSSTFDVKRVSKWLVCDAENQKYSVGKYSVSGNQISFTTKSETGKIDYEGVIDEKSVKLNVFSQITKKSERNRKYKFIKVSFDEK